MIEDNFGEDEIKERRFQQQTLILTALKEKDDIKNLLEQYYYHLWKK